MSVVSAKKWLTLVPAYYRDYKLAQNVLAHWSYGKDFLIQDISHVDDGRYVNKEDAPDDTKFKIRYNNLQDFCIIELVNGVWVLTGEENA